jgi:hypothetical protein
LQLSLLGKVCAPTEERVKQDALEYAHELASTFPIDFIFTPQETREAYLQAIGWEFFSNPCPVVSQIWRGKIDLPVERGIRPLNGLWQTSNRASEQVWRALGTMPRPSMLNITLRSMALTDGDRKFLDDIHQELKKGKDNDSLHTSVLQANLTWAENYFKRRLTPFKKFFHLQVSLLVQDKFDSGLARTIGEAYTRDTPNQPLTGYRIIHPSSETEAHLWREKISSLGLIPTPHRLDDIADIDEVFAVFQLPYLHSDKTPLYNLFFKKAEDKQEG